MSQNNIGEFIQQSRKARGFTQKDLGDRIGVSDKTISKWENGNSIPDTSILNELCATLDINVNELLSGEKLTPEICLQYLRMCFYRICWIFWIFQHSSFTSESVVPLFY